MNNNKSLMLVDGAVLPKVFHGVLEAKKLLNEGIVKTINEATKQAGISRSVYYKYKDYIFPFYEMSRERIMTLLFIVKDKPGVLSEIINNLTTSGANILTINQNIPLNGVAHISISFNTTCSPSNLEQVMEKLKDIKGVKKVDIMAME